MSRLGPGPVVALVTHARDVPAVEREAFAVALHRDGADGSLLLETCHRVEAYLARADSADQAADALPTGGRILTGEDAIRHAIAVAVGRDSVVVGEDQVLHQLRVSVDAARAAGSLDPTLERLFALALQSGRRARSWRQGPVRSLADVALAAIERDAGPIAGRDLLIVGAGRMGGLAVRVALAAGARVAVTSRSAERAASLAAGTGARAEAFDPAGKIAGYAGIIVALGGPWPIATATLDALRATRPVIVDLSVPAAVPGALVAILDARLITADALARTHPGTLADDGPTARIDALIDHSTSEYLAWLGGRDGRAAADALVQHADREREAELAELWRRLPDLEPEAREAIEGMTRHLAGRLLREPLARLGRDADGRDGRAIRDLFAL